MSIKRIERGASDNGHVEVRGGLAEGAQVVTRGAGFLADGDRVRVVPADAPDAAKAPAATDAAAAR